MIRWLVLLLTLPTWAGAQPLTVFAASSLTESFEALGAAFEAEHPGTEVIFNFAGSSTLATQLEQGAPADIFASADWPNLLRVIPESDAVVFATNHLVVITPPDSPVMTLADLATADYRLVLADEAVPAGRYARETLLQLSTCYGPDYSARVLAHLASSEPNVRQVAAKVALGEADAGLVYATDAAILDNVTTLDIPKESALMATYPVGTLRNAPQPELAAAFIAYVLLPESQALLAGYGFSPPP